MVSTIIAKANGRDKVIDFRDGLVLANEEDYAMMHGIGGGKHAPNSVIKVALCDYTAGTGANSRTLFANIAPEVCSQVLHICEGNIGTTVIDGSLAPLVEQKVVNRKLAKAADLFVAAVDKVLPVVSKAAENAEAGKAPAGHLVWKAITDRVGKLLQATMAPAPAAVHEPLKVDCHKDWSYTQDRVHSQRTGTDGFAPVQRLSIFHQTFRKGGDLSRYPWTVKILNGEAKVQTAATGATTFSTATLRETQEAFIQLSDADMYRMFSRVCHYIQTWEIAIAADLIRSGEAAREKERKEYAAGQACAKLEEAAQSAEGAN